MMTTSAPSPLATLAAPAPTIPAPRMTTRPGLTPGRAAEEYSAAPEGSLQVVGAYLRGEAAGDLAHRREHGQAATSVPDGLHGEGDATGVDEGLHQAPG